MINARSQARKNVSRMSAKGSWPRTMKKSATVPSTRIALTSRRSRSTPRPVVEQRSVLRHGSLLSRRRGPSARGPRPLASASGRAAARRKGFGEFHAGRPSAPRSARGPRRSGRSSAPRAASSCRRSRLRAVHSPSQIGEASRSRCRRSSWQTLQTSGRPGVRPQSLRVSDHAHDLAPDDLGRSSGSIVLFSDCWAPSVPAPREPQCRTACGSGTVSP